jgi:hypothetical protein
MGNEITYKDACKLFLNHLKEGKANKRVCREYRIILSGSFKLFIAVNLTVYPLSLEKNKEKYFNKRLWQFNYALKKFNVCIRAHPYLLDKTFSDLFSVMKDKLTSLKPITKKNIIGNIRRLVSLDIDELPVSSIPQNVIKECMGNEKR